MQRKVIRDLSHPVCVCHLGILDQEACTQVKDKPAIKEFPLLTLCLSTALAPARRSCAVLRDGHGQPDLTGQRRSQPAILCNLGRHEFKTHFCWIVYLRSLIWVFGCIVCDYSWSSSEFGLIPLSSSRFEWLVLSG